MKRGIKKKILGMGVVLLSCLLAATSAYALHFELGDNRILDWDTTLRYQGMMRMEDRDATLIADPNGDDGDRNFDQYSLVKNRFDIITEADLNLGTVGPMLDLGIFARAHGWYDFVYNEDHNDHDNPATSNNVSVAYNEFTDETEEWMGRKAEMLDYFLYSAFDIGGHYTTLRVGSQVLNWGTTLFQVGGVMSSQGTIDANGFQVIGAELKELFLPSEQVAVQTDLIDNLSVEAYYQWEWKANRLEEAGGYFSTLDVVDKAGESFIVIPGVFSAIRSADEDPKDDGQWGVAVRYIAEGLNGTEFGLYYIKYHDHFPMLVAGDFIDLTGSGDFAPSTYHLKYAENIELWAASFGTVIGDANVSGEVTYRKNVPVQLPGALPAYERAEAMHYSLSGIYLFPPSLLTFGMTKMGLTAEVGADYCMDKDNDELAYDKFAWGLNFTLTPEYLSLLPKLDLAVPIAVQYNVSGNSILAGGFVEDANKLGVSFNFIYDTIYQAKLGYQMYYGGPKRNARNDRDYLTFILQYTF